MNNIARKNIIYNLSANSDMPYQKIQDIEIKPDQIIYSSINDTFNKLVDNDLYNEKSIINDGNYIYGVKNYDDEIDLKPADYKFFQKDLLSNDNDISILHKKVFSLQESLSSLNINDKIICIQNCDNFYFVGGENGIYIIPTNLSGYEKIQLKNILSARNEKSKATAVYHTNGSNTIYFCTNKALRSFNINIEEPFKQNSDILFEYDDYINDILLYNNNLILAGNKGLYSQYNNDYFSLKPTLTHNELSNKNIFNLLSADDKYMLAATESGIFKSKNENRFDLQIINNNIEPLFSYTKYINIYDTSSIVEVSSIVVRKKDDNNEEYIPGFSAELSSNDLSIHLSAEADGSFKYGVCYASGLTPKTLINNSNSKVTNYYIVQQIINYSKENNLPLFIVFFRLCNKTATGVASQNQRSLENYYNTVINNLDFYKYAVKNRILICLCWAPGAFFPQTTPPFYRYRDDASVFIRNWVKDKIAEYKVYSGNNIKNKPKQYQEQYQFITNPNTDGTQYSPYEFLIYNSKNSKNNVSLYKSDVVKKYLEPEKYPYSTSKTYSDQMTKDFNDFKCNFIGNNLSNYQVELSDIYNNDPNKPIDYETVIIKEINIISNTITFNPHFIASNNGLYYINNLNLKKINLNSNEKVTGICEFDKKLYISFNKEIYYTEKLKTDNIDYFSSYAYVHFNPDSGYSIQNILNFKDEYFIIFLKNSNNEYKFKYYTKAFNKIYDISLSDNKFINKVLNYNDSIYYDVKDQNSNTLKINQIKASGTPQFDLKTIYNKTDKPIFQILENYALSKNKFYKISDNNLEEIISAGNNNIFVRMFKTLIDNNEVIVLLETLDNFKLSSVTENTGTTYSNIRQDSFLHIFKDDEFKTITLKPSKFKDNSGLYKNIKIKNIFEFNNYIFFIGNQFKNSDSTIENLTDPNCQEDSFYCIAKDKLFVSEYSSESKNEFNFEDNVFYRYKLDIFNLQTKFITASVADVNNIFCVIGGKLYIFNAGSFQYLNNFTPDFDLERALKIDDLNSKDKTYNLYFSENTGLSAKYKLTEIVNEDDEELTAIDNVKKIFLIPKTKKSSDNFANIKSANIFDYSFYINNEELINKFNTKSFCNYANLYVNGNGASKIYNIKDLSYEKLSAEGNFVEIKNNDNLIFSGEFLTDLTNLAGKCCYSFLDHKRFSENIPELSSDLSLVLDGTNIAQYYFISNGKNLSATYFTKQYDNIIADNSNTREILDSYQYIMPNSNAFISTMINYGYCNSYLDIFNIGFLYKSTSTDETYKLKTYRQSDLDTIQNLATGSLETAGYFKNNFAPIRFNCFNHDYEIKTETSLITTITAEIFNIGSINNGRLNFIKYRSYLNSSNNLNLQLIATQHQFKNIKCFDISSDSNANSCLVLLNDNKFYKSKDNILSNINTLYLSSNYTEITSLPESINSCNLFAIHNDNLIIKSENNIISVYNYATAQLDIKEIQGTEKYNLILNYNNVIKNDNTYKFSVFYDINSPNFLIYASLNGVQLSDNYKIINIKDKINIENTEAEFSCIKHIAVNENYHNNKPEIIINVEYKDIKDTDKKPFNKTFKIECYDKKNFKSLDIKEINLIESPSLGKPEETINYNYFIYTKDLLTIGDAIIAHCIDTKNSISGISYPEYVLSSINIESELTSDYCIEELAAASILHKEEDNSYINYGFVFATISCADNSNNILYGCLSSENISDLKLNLYNKDEKLYSCISSSIDGKNIISLTAENGYFNILVKNTNLEQYEIFQVDLSQFVNGNNNCELIYILPVNDYNNGGLIDQQISVLSGYIQNNTANSKSIIISAEYNSFKNIVNKIRYSDNELFALGYRNIDISNINQIWYKPNSTTIINISSTDVINSNISSILSTADISTYNTVQKIESRFAPNLFSNFDNNITYVFSENLKLFAAYDPAGLNGNEGVFYQISSENNNFSLKQIEKVPHVRYISYNLDTFFVSSKSGLSSIKYSIDTDNSESISVSEIEQLKDINLISHNCLNYFYLSSDNRCIVQRPLYFNLLSDYSKFDTKLTQVSCQQLIEKSGNDNALYLVVKSDNGSYQAKQIKNIDLIQNAEINDFEILSSNNIKYIYSEYENNIYILNDEKNTIVFNDGNDNENKLITIRENTGDLYYLDNEYIFGKNNFIAQNFGIVDQLYFQKASIDIKVTDMISNENYEIIATGPTGISTFNLLNTNLTNKNHYDFVNSDYNSNATNPIIDKYQYDRFSHKNISKYIVAANNEIISSYNIYEGFNQNKFQNNKVLTLPYHINDIKQINQYTYLIGTDNGIYYTKYNYTLQNDLRSVPFSTIDEMISKSYDYSINNHIQQYHYYNTTIDYINKKVMPVDFSEMAENWQIYENGHPENPEISSNYIVIKNDIVETVDFGDSLQHIKVEYANILTENETTGEEVYAEISDISYICKKWMSGLIELYINIPTTYTYYFPHINGNKDCRYNQDLIDRKNFENMKLFGDISKVKTKFRITIFKKYFGNVQNIISMNLNAQSLPLKIYKDTIYGNPDKNYFHSAILPSIITSHSIYGSDIIINCECFGSDSQALYILADSKKDLTLKFNPVGVLETEQIKDQVYKFGDAINLCEWVKHGYIFKGWAKSPDATEAYYSDGGIIHDFYDIHFGILNLYPVFEKYEFSEKDTIIKLKYESSLENTYLDYINSDKQTIVVDFNFKNNEI